MRHAVVLEGGRDPGQRQIAPVPEPGPDRFGLLDNGQRPGWATRRWSPRNGG